MAGNRREVAAGGVPEVTAASLRWLACPVCRSGLELRESAIHCTGCARHFKIADGLPVLLADAAEPYI